MPKTPKKAISGLLPLIQLPTVSPIRYRGKHPTKIRSISHGGENGLGFIHFELYDGRRFILARRHWLKHQPKSSYFLGRHIVEEIQLGWTLDQVMTKGKLIIIIMSQEEYNGYLMFVRSLRRAKYEADYFTPVCGAAA